MGKIIGLSLFANVGVAEAYFKEIGIDMVLANEYVSKRAAFYQELYPESEMICGDVTDDNIRSEIVDKAIAKKVNFIIATPPCQGMSEAGNRNPLDPRNQLIYYAIDVIKRVLPDYVLLENVPQLLTTTIQVGEIKKLIPEYVKLELGDNYSFNKETLIKTKDYGVPQLRERNIFLLVKKTKQVKWEFPEKEKEITLRDAIGNLPSLDPQLREGLDFTLLKFPDYQKKEKEGLAISKWHRPTKHSWKQVNWMMHTASGESAIFNQVHYPQKENGVPIVAHHNHYRRLNWDKPSRTITQNNGVISSLCCVHPGRKYNDLEGNELYSDARVLSLYEILIVMSLPVDWKIPNWAEESFIRHVIGEGIPPLMVKKVMQVLLSQITRRNN
jgi:DNA (cytosine-5)-methyltransferase 1